MATILYGPRLGNPRASGISVWLRLSDSLSAIALEVKKSSATDWTVADTQTPDSSKRDTVVLTASGLDGGTKYDYRVKDGATVLHTSSTWTMPHSGRFVMCVISDGHGANQAAYDYARTYFEANYEPSSVPMFILQGGDLYGLGGTTTVAQAAADVVEPDIAEISGASRACERLPVLYRADDHDSYGNNGSVEHGVAFTGEANHITAGLQLYDWYWRDMPRPSLGADHMATASEIAGVPILTLDPRTFKTPQTYNTPGFDGIDGSNKFDPANPVKTFLGTAQRNWLISTLNGYVDRALILVHTSDCWLGQQGAMTAGTLVNPIASARDSAGIWWKSERNYVLERLSTRFRHSGQIVWLHGDDHRNAVWRTFYDEPVHCVYNGKYPAAAIEWFGYTFIIRSTTGDNGVGGSQTVFGLGDVLDMGDSVSDGTVAFFDITASKNGQVASMRVTYRSIVSGDVRTGLVGANVGKSADFFWKGGRLEFYADSDLGAQKYPPENGPRTGVRFQRSFIDDVTGFLHYENDMERDDDERLRLSEDVDEPDRDRLMQDWQIRPERQYPGLPE